LTALSRVGRTENAGHAEEDRGSRIEDRGSRHHKQAIFNLQSSIFDPFPRFCIFEEKFYLAWRPPSLDGLQGERYLSSRISGEAAARRGGSLKE
jgi:hypothetical protein